MKWIKTAIGAVIAISFVPFVVLSVINIKEPLETTEEITITFEMDYSRDSWDQYMFDHTLRYDELIDYVEKGYTITNLYDSTNDINITITNWYFRDENCPPYNNNLVMDDNNSVVYELNFLISLMQMHNSYDSIYNANARDIELMDIILTKNPSKIHKLVATLISFVPIIFVGGVLFYFYKPFKEVTGR